MKRFMIITVVAVFMTVTCTAIAQEDQEERKGIRKTLQTVESTTERANTEIGYIIGLAAVTPIVYTAALTWNIIAAPLTALNDTFDAVTTVYKKLRESPDEEPEEQLGELPQE